MEKLTPKQYPSRQLQLYNRKRVQILKKAARKNRALSTVFGTILFLVLVVSAASILFLALFTYNDNLKVATAIEDARSQEKVVMTNLDMVKETVDGATTMTITGINITNLGSITSQIRAFYVDNEFICDPSNSSLNPNGAYINAQNSTLIHLQPVQFNPTSFITVTTSRGIKAIELESNFLNITSSGFTPVITNYGPLRLNFSLFYYRQTDPSGIPTGPWQPGSNISATIDTALGT